MTNVAIIGASRGIGLALAKEYARAGDRVYAFCRTPARATALAQLAAGSGGKLSVHVMDLVDGASIAAGAAALGDAPVDALVTVAGILDERPQGLLDSDFSAWRDAFEVMTIGPFRAALAFLPALEKSHGKIATISSQLAGSAWPYGGLYAYGAAKAGVNRVMRSLAIDLRDKGIAVATLHPGYVKTDMGGPQADITPEESAAGIRSVVAALDMANSGSFLKWNGEHNPW